MLAGFNAFALQEIARIHRRQAAALFVFLVVLAFLIQSQKAVEAHDLSGGAQINALVFSALDLGCDLNRGALQLRRFHLAGDGAGPDQLVKPGLILIQRLQQLAGEAGHICRAHGLMGFLRILVLGRIFARNAWHVFRAVFLFNHAARARNRFGRHVDAVGAHISDKTDRLAAKVHAFIKTLRHAHGVGGRKPQLARGFLLQRRGGERCVGVALCRLGFN